MVAETMAYCEASTTCAGHDAAPPLSPNLADRLRSCIVLITVGTIGSDGSLKGMPEFDGVKISSARRDGLVPVKAQTWEKRVVNLDQEAVPLRDSWRVSEASRASWCEQAALSSPRTSTTFIATGKCCSTIFSMRISRASSAQGAELSARLQGIHHRERRPLLPAVEPDGGFERGRGDRSDSKGDRRTGNSGSIRNLMINCYEGYMDTNLVLPVDV